MIAVTVGFHVAVGRVVTFGGQTMHQTTDRDRASVADVRGLARVMVPFVLCAAVVGGIIGAVLVKVQPSDAQAALTALPASRTVNAELPKAPENRVPVIAASAMPSVVEVHVKSIGGSSTGSGTVLTSTGLILTDYHVIATHDLGATQIDVKVGGQRPASQQASIISADPASDLAVIQVTKEGGFNPASLGDSSTVVPGTQVIAIGSPEGLQGSLSPQAWSAHSTAPCRSKEHAPVKASPSPTQRSRPTPHSTPATPAGPSSTSTAASSASTPRCTPRPAAYQYRASASPYRSTMPRRSSPASARQHDTSNGPRGPGRLDACWFDPMVTVHRSRRGHR